MINLVIIKANATRQHCRSVRLGELNNNESEIENRSL